MDRQVFCTLQKQTKKLDNLLVPNNDESALCKSFSRQKCFQFFNSFFFIILLSTVYCDTKFGWIFLLKHRDILQLGISTWQTEFRLLYPLFDYHITDRYSRRINIVDIDFGLGQLVEYVLRIGYCQVLISGNRIIIRKGSGLSLFDICYWYRYRQFAHSIQTAYYTHNNSRKFLDIRLTIRYKVRNWWFLSGRAMKIYPSRLEFS